MKIYREADLRTARMRARRWERLLGGALALLLALYVFAALRGAQGAMLALLLAAYLIALFVGDNWLLPARRYARFLREMERGLRRSVDCVPESLAEAVQLQDGVRVRSMQVRLCGDGDSRIFYLDAAKAELAPPMGARVRLVSYGRHAVAWEEI